MRIYSKKPDYYDFVVPPSDTVTWRRKSEGFILDETKPLPISLEMTEFLIRAFKNVPLPPVVTSYRERFWDSKDILLLGFCGKLYVVYRVSVGGWPSQEIKPYIDIHEFVEVYNAHSTYLVKFETRPAFSRYPFNPEGMKAWYQEFDQPRRVEEISIAVRAPIFIIQCTYRNIDYKGLEFSTNPNMSEYGLQRLFDPWTTYQEIEMYLTNTLAVEVEKIPDFGDKLKRDAHGFDDWSFKQVGPKPRKRK
jgi:hypothetical protein